MAQNVVLLLFVVILGFGSLFGSPGVVPEVTAPHHSNSTSPLLALVQAENAPMFATAHSDEIITTIRQGEPLVMVEPGSERHRVRTVSGAEGYVPAYLVRTAPNVEVDEDFIVMGYYMQDAKGVSLSSLDNNADALTAVSPWSWGVTYTGELRPVYFQEKQLGQLLALAGSKGLQTHALIHNFNPELGTFDTQLADAILADPIMRSQTARTIVDTVARWGMTGIHIDFEGVNAARRHDLTAFIAHVAELARPLGLQVSMAVPAKTAATAKGLWTAAYDYAALAQHVDFLMIMAYDQHWRGDVAGPIAALPWVRDVIEYTLDPSGGAVPAGKVVLGIAAYGYDWPASGGWADAVTYDQAMNRLEHATKADASVQVQWHAEHQSPYFVYGGRTVWFENEHSIAHKLQLAAEYDLGGVAFWRLGQEDVRVWDAVKRLTL